jgi:hypothetical protein
MDEGVMSRGENDLSCTVIALANVPPPLLLLLLFSLLETKSSILFRFFSSENLGDKFISIPGILLDAVVWLRLSDPS